MSARALDLRRRRLRPRGSRRVIVKTIAGIGLGQNVRRQFEEHRAWAAVPEQAERVLHHLRYAPYRIGGLAILGDLTEVAYRAKIRRDRRHTARMPSRKIEDRTVVAESLRNGGESRFRAGAVLHRNHAELLPRRHAAVAVGDVHRHALGAGDDRPDAERRARSRRFRCAGSRSDIRRPPPSGWRPQLRCRSSDRFLARVVHVGFRQGLPAAPRAFRSQST